MNLATFPFPQVNATLNGISAVLLMSGWLFIKRRIVRAHAACMITAIVASTLFLVSYLTYHSFHGVTKYVGPARSVYFAILSSHTILAAVIVPLVIVTVTRAAKRQWLEHRRIAVWTFPIWLYVSITGVIIYWMLYHLGSRT